MSVPVVMVPGAGLPAALTYADLLPALGADVQPVLKDLELFADEYPPNPYSLDLEVEALAAAADDAGLDRFHLLGYSAGGAVSLAFAAAHPGRLTSLALIEPAWAGNEGRTPEEHQVWVGLERAMALPVPERMAQFRRLHLRPGVELPPPDDAPPPPWMARRPRGLPVLVTAFAEHRLEPERLAALQAPVYVAVGGRSNPDYFARAAARLASTFPHCEVEDYPERHHFDPPQHAEPERLAAALRRLWAAAARVVDERG